MERSSGEESPKTVRGPTPGTRSPAGTEVATAERALWYARRESRASMTFRMSFTRVRAFRTSFAEDTKPSRRLRASASNIVAAICTKQQYTYSTECSTECLVPLSLNFKT